MTMHDKMKTPPLELMLSDTWSEIAMQVRIKKLALDSSVHGALCWISVGLSSFLQVERNTHMVT